MCVVSSSSSSSLLFFFFLSSLLFFLVFFSLSFLLFSFFFLVFFVVSSRTVVKATGKALNSSLRQLHLTVSFFALLFSFSSSSSSASSSSSIFIFIFVFIFAPAITALRFRTAMEIFELFFFPSIFFIHSFVSAACRAGGRAGGAEQTLGAMSHASLQAPLQGNTRANVTSSDQPPRVSFFFLQNQKKKKKKIGKREKRERNA